MPVFTVNIDKTVRNRVDIDAPTIEIAEALAAALDIAAPRIVVQVDVLNREAIGSPAPDSRQAMVTVTVVPASELKPGDWYSPTEDPDVVADVDHLADPDEWLEVDTVSEEADGNVMIHHTDDFEIADAAYLPAASTVYRSSAPVRDDEEDPNDVSDLVAHDFAAMAAMLPGWTQVQD